jgi:superfamily II helicase
MADCNPDSKKCLLKKAKGKAKKKVKKIFSDPQVFELEKICARCKKRKELASFCKNKRKTDGYNNYCRECAAIIRKENLKKWDNDDEINFWINNKNLEKMLPSLRERNWEHLNGVKILKELESII